jgi:hypothetical protein
MYSHLDPDACLDFNGVKDAKLKNDLCVLVSSALASSTWKKHISGWNAYCDFENYCDCKFQWPLSMETLRSFVIYCLTSRKISVGTTKAYLSSVKLAHELRNLECKNYGDDRIIKLLYAGAENVIGCNAPIAEKRRAMNLSTLLLIGHRIASSDWQAYSKQIVWTACTVAFFTSVRMGEILVQNEKVCDVQTTLMWQDVKFLESKDILLKLPFTKTTKFQGCFMDVFPFPAYPCCPVAALARLKEMALAEGIYDSDLPVFTFASGKFLTTGKLNQILKDLLQDIYIPGVSVISSHSFRAAIPSAIGAFPDKMLVAELKDWGNWEGDSYKLYVRMRKSQRKALFKKVTCVLTANM